MLLLSCVYLRERERNYWWAGAWWLSELSVVTSWKGFFTKKIKTLNASSIRFSILDVLKRTKMEDFSGVLFTAR